jgi:hypothetical protein
MERGGMNSIGLGICLIALVANGCASHPPQELPLDSRAIVTGRSQEWSARSFTALPTPEGSRTHRTEERQSRDSSSPSQSQAAYLGRTSRQEYERLSLLPEAESRELRFYLNRQMFDYFEDGELLVSGPISSGKAGHATPTGTFSVLAKEKDKESSLYTNEAGTQAWMPYSIQFHGNYFIHEGWLPGHPASHGCIRLGHLQAKLLFERMKIADPVTVNN